MRWAYNGEGVGSYHLDGVEYVMGVFKHLEGHLWIRNRGAERLSPLLCSWLCGTYSGPGMEDPDGCDVGGPGTRP